MRAYAHLPHRKTPAFADIALLELLLEHGEEWADDTTYCMRSLDSRLHPLLSAAGADVNLLKCFSRQGQHFKKTLRNFMMYASTPQLPLIAAILAAVCASWRTPQLYIYAVSAWTLPTSGCTASSVGQAVVRRCVSIETRCQHFLPQ